MSPEKAKELLKMLQTRDDYECTHSIADDIMCDLLNSLGYGDVVAEYNLVGKYYS